ncbi:MAG: gamma-glutamyl-gamma-aminobutyrate hydrolase family protein [Lachnospiraceae bacterium]|nr:gamma-glutamyl-gamma-aminobutyrate hydrolase family protein [Lachnospiraceae bacterium]
MKPIIGVIPLVDIERNSFWMLPGYMNGIIAVGGMPIMLPLTGDPKDIAELLSQVQGIVFSGGHDVDPSYYGEQVLNDTVATCISRDEMEMEVLRQALGLDMPVLGICRGIQLMNVGLGGSLYQDLPTQHPSEVNHRQPVPYNKPIHEVTVNPESSLGQLIQKSRLQVNSMHHQAIKDLAADFSVMAVSEDGLVEAVEIKGKRFAWAVQWHPEHLYPVDPDHKAVLEAFVQAARDYQNDKM